MEIDFYPLDIDNIDDADHQPIIRIFGRTPQGKRVCILDRTFKPYIYATLPENTAPKTIQHISSIIKTYPGIITVTATMKKSLQQELPTLKITYEHPKQQQAIRHQLKEHEEIQEIYELDIPYIRQYLLNKKITPTTLCKALGTEINAHANVDIILDAEEVMQVNEDTIQPNILAFDIEVYNPYIAPREQEDPIVMIAFHGKNYKKMITWKNIPGKTKEMIIVKDEKELLETFIKEIKNYQPDYIIGYFSDGFDFPYIKARARKHKLNLDLGLDYSELQINRRVQTGAAQITGIPHIDIYKFIKRVTAGGEIELESYDLDTVAQEMLGEGKKKVVMEDLATTWDKGGAPLKTFAEYNMKDAELTYRLAEQMLPNLHEMIKLVGQNIYDVARMTFGQMVEWYLIKNIERFNQLIPNRPMFGEIEERAGESYEGAFVYEPQPGLYQDIVGFDFRSLYPSVIISHNICLSTATDSKHGEASPTIQQGKKEIKYYFNQEEKGFIPAILRDIVERRARIKTLMKTGNKKDPILNARQYSLKILANSFYGYLGFSGARWYSNDAAATVTAWARYYIHDAIKKFEDNGFHVLYGDTDSIYLELQKKKKEDAIKLMEVINKQLPDIMELELESHYPRGIFVKKKGGGEKGAKKKYALIDEKGIIKVRGFETIRGDWSIIAREVQQHILELILKDNKPEEAITYIKDIIKKTRTKKIQKEKMVIKKQLKKEIKDYDNVGPHVAVAQQMEKKGMQIKAGMIIKYIVDEGQGMIRDRARTPEEANTYDAEYYINNQILPAVLPLLEVLGYDKETLSKQHEQKGIMDY
ncbi:MAG: DNA-directed DNA polymerase [Nanoarchaeota archaeon]|nr:DNA-directed DNA polymerase [Nanoarchaeota archaeon]